MGKAKQAAIEKSPVKFTLADDAENSGNFSNIEISRIVVSALEPQARRRMFFKDADVDELGNSIVRHGLRQPILVRPRKLLETENSDQTRAEFEIVFGERRFLAARAKALATIKSFVETLSDAEAIELQYAENHGRENPDPLSDAFTYQYLIERENYTEAKLADHFNIAPKLVTERLRLNDLIEPAKAQLSAGDLPLRHAYYLAKFPHSAQAEIVAENFAYKWRDSSNGAVSYNDFKREVEENIVRRLADAPFDTENTELHPKGLSCTRCTERSGYTPKLYTDDFAADDVCFDRKCFEAKTGVSSRLVRLTIAESLPNPKNLPVAEMVKKVPLVSDRPTAPSAATVWEKPQIVQTMQIAPECEFAQPSLAVAGANRGREVYICTEKSCTVHNPPLAEEKTDDGISLMHANQIRTEVFRRALDWFDNYKVFWQFDDLIQNLIVQFVWEVRFSHGDELLFLIKDWKDAPRNFSNIEKVQEFAATLDKRRQSQMLFLLANLSELSVSSERADDTGEIRKIARGFGNLDYDKIAEEVW